MGTHRLFQVLGLSCAFSIAVAAWPDSKARIAYETRNRGQYGEASSSQPQISFLAKKNVATGARTPTSDSEKKSSLRASLLDSFNSLSRWQQYVTNSQQSVSNSYSEDNDDGSDDDEEIANPQPPSTISHNWDMLNLFDGISTPGVSMSQLNDIFKTNLRPSVRKHVSKSVGGVITEYGDKDDPGARRAWTARTCVSRPSLTIDQVRQIARDSFGIPDFEITIPPCNNGGKKVACNYDGGTCCQRPQIEFLGRYYDTAVAAMALGATLDEAFAPLLHARVLAFALESCDPTLSFRGNITANVIEYKEKSISWGEDDLVTKHWSGENTSLISFPAAYEVLYELYNTMLIERMRSRRTTKFPTHAQMKKLYAVLYYKKFMARAAYIDLDLHPSFAFPSYLDLKSAGLTPQWSQWEPMSRMETSSDPKLEETDVSKMHHTLRSSGDSISLYELRTSAWKHVDDTKCNHHLSSPGYYPYKFQERVWNEFEGCCATECKFMALYGSTFSVHSSNCCAGCNRYRCEANDAEVAEMFAEISTIEVSPKKNSGPEEIALVA